MPPSDMMYSTECGLRGSQMNARTSTPETPPTPVPPLTPGAPPSPWMRVQLKS